MKDESPVMLSTPERIQQQKNNLLQALIDNRGIISKACAQVGLNRSTYYEYFNNDPEFQREASEMQEIALDHVEGKLHELIDGVEIAELKDGRETVYRKEPNVTATIFYLKTKGKKRGYIEKQEMEHIGLPTVDPLRAALDFLTECRNRGLSNAEIVEGLDMLDEVDREARERVKGLLVQ